jgi:hypothetical protein
MMAPSTDLHSVVDAVARAWTAVSPFFYALFGGLLSRWGERARDQRADLRSRLEAQYNAYADFAAYCAKHLPAGDTWGDALRVEATALVTKMSVAYADPAIADKLFQVLFHVANWKAGGMASPAQVELFGWVSDTKAALQRSMAGTQERLGLPKLKVRPVLPEPPKTIGERVIAVITGPVAEEEK